MYVLNCSGRYILELSLVEVLHHHRGQVPQPYVAYLREDVLTSYLLVSLPGSVPQRTLGGLQPTLGVLLYSKALILRYKALINLVESSIKLLGYLCLSLTVDVLPFTVDLISGLPTPVFPLGDGTLSFCPSHAIPFG